MKRTLFILLLVFSATAFGQRTRDDITEDEHVACLREFDAFYWFDVIRDDPAALNSTIGELLSLIFDCDAEPPSDFFDPRVPVETTEEFHRNMCNALSRYKTAAVKERAFHDQVRLSFLIGGAIWATVTVFQVVDFFIKTARK